MHAVELVECERLRGPDVFGVVGVDQLEMTADDRQRGAQLVADVVEERDHALVLGQSTALCGVVQQVLGRRELCLGLLRLQTGLRDGAQDADRATQRVIDPGVGALRLQRVGRGARDQHGKRGQHGQQQHRRQHPGPDRETDPGSGGVPSVPRWGRRVIGATGTRWCGVEPGSGRAPWGELPLALRTARNPCAERAPRPTRRAPLLAGSTYRPE